MVDATRAVSWLVVTAGLLLAFASCTTSADGPAGRSGATPAGSLTSAQAPSWTRADLDFFLHGSMSAEMVPERVLIAFIRAYPDLFPKHDLSHFGLLPDRGFGWPLGVSRKRVPHLGGLSAVGVNCAACHLGEVVGSTGEHVQVLGMTSHFDAEAFFNAVIVATFRTAEPAAMKRFLHAYLAAVDLPPGEGAHRALANRWQQQEQAVTAAITADPPASKGIAPGALHEIAAADLEMEATGVEAGQDLVPLVRAMLKLFHNVRAALHIPDVPPAALPPASGPGRNDAFGLLAAALLGSPQPYAPVKFGLVWNLDTRRWVHWDGNTQSPIGRNLLASLGLGAPLLGREGRLDFAAVQRQTDLSETIRAPRYPFAIDESAARRGEPSYRAHCGACHDGPETDARLRSPEQVGTDPGRARAFKPPEADGFNRLLAELQAPGYRASPTPGIRSTQKYWTPSLAGVWARSPYLHNGSVRTMRELLTAPADRATSFRRGSPRYDEAAMGYADEGPYVLDTRTPGNGNMGHAYGAGLSAGERRDLIEFLKTL